VVHGGSPGGPRLFGGWHAVVLEEKGFQKLHLTLNELKIHPYMSVLKLPFLVGL
jgi:hypothetical protein